jgi:hypothetical protein
LTRFLRRTGLHFAGKRYGSCANAFSAANGFQFARKR